MSVNKVILVGRLGANPELKQTTSGNYVCKISLALGEKFKDKSGNVVEKTEWVNCVFWNVQAEHVAQYLHKGDQAYVEGKLVTRKYQAQDGTDRYTTEVHAYSVQFLTSPAQKADQPQQAHQPPQEPLPPAQQPRQRYQPPQGPQPAYSQGGYPPPQQPSQQQPQMSFNPDDIPF